MSYCEICGEPMPVGEEMFKFHGYSGKCPKPVKDLKIQQLTPSHEIEIVGGKFTNAEQLLEGVEWQEGTWQGEPDGSKEQSCGVYL